MSTALTDLSVARLSAADLTLAQLMQTPGVSLSELAPGFPLLHLRHGELRATVSLYGGQLLSCQQGEQALLWSNPSLMLTPGKALRAGVPICWPWFGTLDPTLPSHGFVRTRLWHVASVQHTDTALTLTLSICDDDDTRTIWPHRFDLQLQVRLSEVLSVQLLMHNRDQHAYPVAGALHSYLAVHDIAGTTVAGLDGVSCYDQLKGQIVSQHGDMDFRAETDRICHFGAGRLHIADGHARLQLQQHGNTDTVVWTPWSEKAARLGDVSGTDWRQFVCVETAIANDHAVILPPGAQYAMGFTLTGNKTNVVA